MDAKYEQMIIFPCHRSTRGGDLEEVIQEDDIERPGTNGHCKARSPGVPGMRPTPPV